MNVASSSEDLISSNRRQDLSEIVQNADDVNASELLIQLRNADLLATHNGSPVPLNDALRVFLDPLKQLQPTERGSITLSGVREAKSLVYTFNPTDDGSPLTAATNR